MELKNFLSGSGTAPDSVTALQTNTWYYVHATWDGALAKIYINGLLETTKAASGTIVNTSHSLKMGTIETRYTAGQIDEARVSRVARGSNWVWACYMNTASNAQFCGYSSQAPVNPDSDGDGLPDEWEMTYFGNLTTANATSDFDHDGQSDLKEYRAGTNPTNSASVFAFTQSSYSSQAGGLVLTWQSVAGKLYTLEQTTNLLGGGWQAVISNLTATPPVNTYTTPLAPSKSLYYRMSTH